MDAWVQPASWNGEVVGVLLDEPWPGRIAIGSHGYAQVCTPEQRVVPLHRALLGLRTGDKLFGDHINGSALDNRRANLRVVTASGSSQNVSGRGASLHRGVYRTRGGRWSAGGKYQGVQHYLGTYDTEEQAAAVAKQWRIDNLPDYVDR